jgi:hypothetical protein
MANLDPKELAEPDGNHEPCDNTNERYQVCLDACGARHSLKELSPIQDAYSIEEHDQAGKAYRPGNLRFWREGSDGQTNEQDGPNAERESEDVDLPDQITDADRKEHRKDRLAAEDVLR